MARITLEGIAHSYEPSLQQPADFALTGIDHVWEDGGAYALLGPSGCGKTTLLNVVSGLLTPSHGRVLFDQQDVTRLAPEQRNIAQVFQFPVVYDSMSVAENLAFPLRNRGVAKTLREQRVSEVMSMLELTDVAHKPARGLSADAKQKISLGRGLVRTDVAAILFDEPLTVIDPALKWQLRAQLKRVHQQFGHTMIYVTHDQTEALTFADKVVVMLEGKVLQIGTPEQLFDAPAHTFVGNFIGSPGMNILPCQVQGQLASIGQRQLRLGQAYPATMGQLQLGIRPEYIDLVEQNGEGSAWPVSILAIEDLGRCQILQLALDEHQLKVLLPEGTPLPVSPAVRLRPDHVKIYCDALLLAGSEDI